MVGERADFLVAGLAWDTMAEDQRVSRPGTPLPVLIGSAEEDDRERARRCRQVRRAGIGADEEVGPFEQGGGLGDRQAAGPVAEPIVRRQVLDNGASSIAADDDDAPAVLEKSLDQGLP